MQTSQSAMDAGVAVALLYGPPLLVLLSSISVLQLQMLVGALATFSKGKGSSAAWKAVKPALRNVATILEENFGGSSKVRAVLADNWPSLRCLTPDPQPTATTMLLIAVVLAVLYAGERVSSAVRASTAAKQIAAPSPSQPPTPETRKSR